MINLNNSFNFFYYYRCPECYSELEFKSVNKASDQVLCMCGFNMNLIRLWAKNQSMAQSIDELE